MEALRQNFEKRNFVFFAVSVDYEERKKVKEFIDKHGYTFSLIVDPKNHPLNLMPIHKFLKDILTKKIKNYIYNLQ